MDLQMAIEMYNSGELVVIQCSIVNLTNVQRRVRVVLGWFQGRCEGGVMLITFMFVRIIHRSVDYCLNSKTKVIGTLDGSLQGQ